MREREKGRKTADDCLKEGADVAVGEWTTRRKEISSQTKRCCKYNLGRKGPVMHC
jgi:hypothetical protein